MHVFIGVSLPWQEAYKYMLLQFIIISSALRQNKIGISQEQVFFRLNNLKHLKGYDAYDYRMFLVRI